MKHIIFFILAVLSLNSWNTALAEQGNGTPLSLIYSNDQHGEIEPCG